MALKTLFSRKNRIEAIFQIALLVMVFIFYAFERKKGQHEFQFHSYTFAFFLNYVFAAFIINYYLLPKFLYRKKYVQFTALVLVLLAIVIVMEEAVIEQIYFPDTRGASFPGVFTNLAGALPTITILAGFKFAWDALRKQNELEDLQMAVKDSELQYLKSQINPHFLFNNLNNLYAYSLENSPKTPEIILELSGVLRYMLYECKEEFVPLPKEIEQLENFVNLSKLQFEKRGDIEFVATNISSELQIAPLILSVFVENAFKHSLSSQTDSISIRIVVSISNNDQLNFSCVNSFSEQSNTADLSRGIGLENVKKRLDLLYADAHKLEIKVADNEYSVDLSLNLKERSHP